jgi:multidrug efflux pump subunit AcrA (membrane-fusion protein)
MRKHYTAKPHISTGVSLSVTCQLLSVILFLAAGCTLDNRQGTHAKHAVHADSSPLSSVIYHSGNAAVNKQVIANLPVIRPDSGTRILTAGLQGRVVYDTRDQAGIASRVSGRIEKLYIRYNYQPVQKGQLIMELYSPDLVAAQRELLFIDKAGDDKAMLQRARQRLLLLGMQEQQIAQVLRTGNPFYRLPVYSQVAGYIAEKAAGTTAGTGNGITVAPANSQEGMDGMGATAGNANNETTATVAPVLLREGQYVSAGQTLFTIYTNNGLVAEFAFPPSLAAVPAKGQKLVFHRTGEADKTFTGVIGLIQPVVQSGQPFTQARVYLSGTAFRPGQLLTGYMPVVVHKGWWIPAAALWQTGNKAVVFRKEGGAFVPEKVTTGIVLNGMVQVLESIGGWELAATAAYLVDSESFVQ